MKKYRNIPEEIVNRYQEIIQTTGQCPYVAKMEYNETRLEHLAWMLTQLNTQPNSEKDHRWLGFVQGVLISKGLTTVAAERDFTRDKFYKRKSL